MSLTEYDPKRKFAELAGAKSKRLKDAKDRTCR